MSSIRITPEALRMAWKMVDTIFPRAKMTPNEQDQLLNLTMVVALNDLLDNAIVWEKTPQAALSLVFQGQSVVIKTVSNPKDGLPLEPTDEETDDALDQAERIFDQYELDDEERSTLFTALPCLGLDALRDYLRWTKPPPFAELGTE